MSRTHMSRILVVLVLFIASGAALLAVGQGRLIITVKNERNEKMPGVTITVTCPELDAFEEVRTTNKKGQLTFGFADATRRYEVQAEFEGYHPISQTFKPDVGLTGKMEIIMQPQESASVGGIAQLELSAAEKTFNEGALALQDGDLVTAEAKFNEALRQDRKLTAAISGLGAIYLRQEKYEAALGEADRLLELNDENATAYRLKYNAYRGLGQEKEAKEALKRMAELDKTGDPVALVYNQAVDAMKIGDLDAAKMRFAEALELSPELEPALAALAGLYFDTGEHLEAAAVAEKLLALDPTDLRALTIRWDAYRILGDEAKTAEAYAALSAVNPAVVATQFYDRGKELFEAGDVPGAQGQFERAVEIDPDNGMAHYRLALCYLAGEKNSEAKAHLQRFLELDPDNVEAQSARDMLGYL